MLSMLSLLTACQRPEEVVAPEVRPVRFTTIETSSTSAVVTLVGRVQAQTEINQSFRIDGRLVERAVDVGEIIKKGQLIARVDPENEESGVQAAQAQLLAAQARLIEARSNEVRMRELIAEKAVSQAAFEQAKALLAVAESQVKSGEAQVTLAKNRLSYTRLYSNVGGVVTSRGAEPGEVISAGRMIIQVAEDGARDAVFDVPASVKNQAVRDAEIRVSLTSDPRITALGKVREVAPRADPVTGTFTVRIQLIKPPLEMRLGSTVTGQMSTDTLVAIELPSSALFRSTDGQAAVWLVDPQSMTVALRNIEVSAYGSNNIQVSKGLSPGDKVVTAGAQTLRPGQKVELLSQAKGASL
jgi:RND family efflux transporter MFP subunit